MSAIQRLRVAEDVWNNGCEHGCYFDEVTISIIIVKGCPLHSYALPRPIVDGPSVP